MLKGFGIATIAVGAASAVAALIWGIIASVTTGGFFALLPLFYGIIAAMVITFLFVGAGMAMIRIEQIYRAIYKN